MIHIEPPLRAFLALVLLCGTAAAAASPNVTVHLNASAAIGGPVSPLLWGASLEDVGHAFDGALYLQYMQNNGFQGDDPGLTGWEPVNDQVDISEDSTTPLNSAITSTLRLQVSTGATGRTGVINELYGRYTVFNTIYSHFYIKGAFDGDMIVQFVPKDKQIRPLNKVVTVHSVVDKWTLVTAKTYAGGRQDIGGQLAVWQLSFDASLLAGRHINIGFPTLDFDADPNALVAGDVFTDLAPDVGGGPLRFPGGRNLLGTNPGNRWKWNETIGNFSDRPGRQGAYGYPNTDGIGLMEFLWFAEAHAMSPVPAIWAGLSLGSAPLVGHALQPYVDDALAELEFLLGATSTPRGKLRARYGHPTPYKIQYVEIGSEDHLNGGCASYPQRFIQFHDAIRAAYPRLGIVASTANRNCLPSPIPKGVVLDRHVFESPDALARDYHLFDNSGPAHPILVGAFHSTIAPYATILSACSEFVFMLGWEENSDAVLGGAYAPSLARLGSTDENGNIIVPRLTYYNGPDFPRYFEQVSEYGQTLFGFNLRNRTAFSSDVPQGPLYWAASIDSTGLIYLKVANFGDSFVDLHLHIPYKVTQPIGYPSVSGDPGDYNSPDNVTKVEVRENVYIRHVPNSNRDFQTVMRPYEFGVMIISGPPQ